MSAAAGVPGLPEWREIDAACDRFEAAWRAGDRPEAGDFLDGFGAEARACLLRELLILEVEFRLAAGEPPDPRAYLARYPEAADAVAGAFAYLGKGADLTLAATPGRGSSNGSDRRATVFGQSLPPAEIGPEAKAALQAAGYEVLGTLGHGGMGIVYLARKVALGRLCALKMIGAGVHAGAAAVARFRAEAAAVARLRHPEIVQIFHVGEADGRPFIELEYVPGGSLDRALNGTPWPVDKAARLVEVLAWAIAEAHRRGIVHRDLKPANILLELDGHPKVADFGLAKFLDTDAGMTRSHVVLGTPSYMAPEQAEGGSRLVGATTDVYALGAILYELLTGRPPFRAATSLETLAQVKGSDPVPPSRFQPGLPRDAETICLKCLEKAPARRYPTAEALAEDLGRFLEGRPILARRVPGWERAWRWSRRRPATATGLLIVMAALLLGGAGVMHYNARLRDAVRQAQASARAAAEERNLALRTIHQLVFVDREGLGEAMEAGPLRRRQLASAIRLLDELGRRAAESAPDFYRAVVHQKLGDIYAQVGRAAEARQQYQQARALADRLAAAAPADLPLTECLRGTHYGLGILGLRAERNEEARDHFRRVIELSEAILAAEPDRPGARRGLLEAYLQLGRAFAFAHDLDAAGSWFRTMHDRAARWAVAEPRNAELKDMLATSLRKLADNRKLGGDPAGSRADYRRAIALSREALAADPGNPAVKGHLATALDDLAGVNYTLRDLDAAGPLFREADRLFEERAEADLEDLEAQLKLVRTRTNLANLERDEGHFAEAADLARSALARLVRLGREGRLEGRSPSESRRVADLERMLADCRIGPDALGDLAGLRARPPREAARLFRIRARVLAAKGLVADLIATLEMLDGLTPEDPEGLYEQARSLAANLDFVAGGPWTGPSSPERLALRQRFADRALEALSRAASRGLGDPGRLERDDAFGPLRRRSEDRERFDRLLRRPASPPEA